MIKGIIQSIRVLCFVAINSVLLNLLCVWIQSSKSAFVHTPVLASWLWESTFVHLQPLHPHQCRVHIYLPVHKGLGQFQPQHPHQCRVHIYLPMKALDTCNIYTLTSEHQDVVHFQILQYAGEGSIYLFRGERARDVSIYLGWTSEGHVYLGVNWRGACPSI